VWADSQKTSTCEKNIILADEFRPATLFPMNIHQILDYLKEEISRLDGAINALEGVVAPGRRGRPPKSQASPSASRKRTMSPAARKRIGAAKKAWWAAQQKGKSAPKKAAKKAAVKKPARKPMSPAARKKLAALMKARWAEKKKAGATSL
jgi:hypothetical protein